MGNRGAETPTSFVSLEIGPNTPRHSVSPLAPRAFTRASLAHDSYETTCRRCERWITLQSAAQHANVVAHLSWRKQKSWPRGRSLDADIPPLGVKKHDRLEPWTSLQDIGDEFDQLQPTAARPVRVCFGAALRRLQCGIDLRCWTRDSTRA